MREDPLWARIALLLNLAGTVLLGLSFSATSSDFRLVTAKGHDLHGAVNPVSTTYALCVRDFLILQTNSQSGIAFGRPGCPNTADARAVAVVNTEHPSFIFLGLLMSSIGFLLQFFIVPRRKTLSEVSEELRLLRKQKRLIQTQMEKNSPE